MAWNSSGNLLASASDKGTVLRVHSMPQVAYGQQSLLLEKFTVLPADFAIEALLRRAESGLPAGQWPQLRGIATDDFSNW